MNDIFEKHEGILFAWFETGLEGITWALQEFKHADETGWSYEGLVTLKNLDILFVLDQEGNKVWSGILELDKTRTAHGYHIWGLPKGWDSRKWMEMMFKEEHVGIILRLKKGQEVPKNIEEIKVSLETKNIKSFFKKK